MSHERHDPGSDVPGQNAFPGSLLSRIDHIGIAVFDLEQSLERYRKLFRVEAKYIETLESLSIRIAFLPVGEVMLELLAPLPGGKGNISAFLEQHGEGFHHIAYRVEDIHSLLSDLKRSGIGLRDEKPRPGGGGSWIAFVKPEETSNVLTELVQREKDL